MKTLDVVAAIPAIIVGVVAIVYMVRYGDLPIKSKLRFFGTMSLIALGLVLWSVGLDAWARSPWDRWFVHLITSYVFPSVGVMIGWVHSLFHPVFRRT